MFSKSLVILFAAISFANVALASPHLVNRRHHHALAARGHSVARNASDRLENRALRKRCRSRSPPSSSSSSSAVSSAVSSPTPVNVAPTTTVSSSSSSTTPEQQTPPPPPPPPASTTSTQESAPTQGSDNSGQGGDNNGGNSGGNSGGGVLDLPSFAKGSLTGDGTYYDTGLTACGGTYTDDDKIVAVSKLFFDIWPGSTGNPNNNPICGKMIRAHYGGNSVDLTVTDRCEGCKIFDIDMTPTAFSSLANKDKGRLPGVTWEFI